MLVGYMRVSTQTQADSNNNFARQEEALLNYGVAKENIYKDVISGAKDSRPALAEMKKFLREGDTVVCSEISRLGRNTKGLLTLIEEFKANNIGVFFIKEGIDTRGEMAEFFITVLSACASLEREQINARCQQGREIAKREKRMGRKRIDNDNMTRALRLFEDGNFSVAQITADTGISSATLYRRAKQLGITRKC